MRHVFRWSISVLLVLAVILSPVYATKTYQINETDISYDSVAWKGTQGCWDYANDMYALIWGVRFDSTFAGSPELGSNLLQDLSAEERQFTTENAEIFVKSSVPGAVIRITNSDSEDDLADSDGRQPDGTYGHCLIIAAIYDEGFIAFENTASGCSERFYTWVDFYQAWSALSYSTSGGYTFFKYIKWPGAPVLHRDAPQTFPTWGWLLVAIIAALCILLIWIMIWRKRQYKDPLSDERRMLPLCVFTAVFPFLFGGYYVWSSAIATLFKPDAHTL